MERIGIAILVGIVGAIISVVHSAINNNRLMNKQLKIAHKEYTNALANSNGLEKIRLIIRREGQLNLYKFKKGNRVSWPNLEHAMRDTFIGLVDTFYSMLDESCKKINQDIDENTSFDRLADKIASNHVKRNIIIANALGISFAIVVSKVAELGDDKIRESTIKKYIHTIEFEEDEVEELLRMILTFFNFEKDELYGLHTEGMQLSKDLESMGNALLDEDMNKKDFANPLITMSMSMAIVAATRNISFLDEDKIMEEMENVGLIK